MFGAATPGSRFSLNQRGAKKRGVDNLETDYRAPLSGALIAAAPF
jgi:hypothetical protein